MSNKLTLELEIPTTEDENAPNKLEVQARSVIKLWGAATSVFKEKGISVPELYMKKVKPKFSDEQKAFTKTLLDYHLQHAPKAIVAPQVAVIKQLYETGLTADELIKVYDQSHDEYPMTTWLTVKYKINKTKEPVSEAVELTEDKVQNIKDRYSTYD